MNFYYRTILVLSLFAFTPLLWANCQVFTSNNKLAVRTHDVLGKLLFTENNCPTSVFDLREVLKRKNLKLETTMVANRGYHNPKEGSFSLFEIVSGEAFIDGQRFYVQPGDFFFGHFTTVDSANHLIADQNPEKGSLMVEAFAWDDKKKNFNFYELRGDGKQGQWYYRGDSKDIFADNFSLHLQQDPNHPKFGNRLRCSACHDAGAGIMKEIHAPYNDWWTQARPLPFGERLIDARLKEILQNIVPAERLAESVKVSVEKLHPADNQTLSLREQLRPLFCPVEVNLKSDTVPNDLNKETIEIPLSFFVDERLLSNAYKKTVTISRAHYLQVLTEMGSYFPETNLQDADHAWLTPVKASSDILAIDSLIKRSVIDEKFVVSVLAIDKLNPVFSQDRCGLLKYVPEKMTNDWLRIFIQNIKYVNAPAERQWVMNYLTEDIVHAQKAHSELVLMACREKLTKLEHVRGLYRLLMQRRVELRHSEISANPKGQILEPGFRVIFPEQRVTAAPNQLHLTQDCEVN